MASNYFIITFVFVMFLALIGLLCTVSIGTGEPHHHATWVEHSTMARRQEQNRALRSVAEIRKTTKPTLSITKAQHNKATQNSITIVFDEPMLNYMYGIKKQSPCDF